MGEIALRNSIDYMTDRFQAVIKEFDSFKEYITNNPRQIEELKNHIRSLNDSIINITQVMGLHIKEYDSYNAKNKAEFEDIKKELSSLKGQISSEQGIRAEIHNSIACHEQQLKKVEVYQDQYCSKVSQAVVMNDLENTKKKGEEDLTKLRSDFKNSIDEVYHMNKNSYDIQVQTTSQISKRLDELSSFYEEFQNSAKIQTLHFDGQISILKSSIASQIDQALALQPKSVIPSLDEAKAAMKKELEPVSLDAKNANLRSTNTENEVHLLKKKIESISLMIKKIELERSI